MLKLTSTISVLTFTLTSCLSSAFSDGSDIVIKESSNERHDKKVILFLRQAGATVDDSYQVKVMDFNNKFNTKEVVILLYLIPTTIKHRLTQHQ